MGPTNNDFYLKTYFLSFPISEELHISPWEQSLLNGTEGNIIRVGEEFLQPNKNANSSTTHNVGGT